MISRNIKVFKKEIGQANHFLITILIGLNGVKSGCINKNIEFSTSWNPKNKISSANRSRDFAKKSALTWVVDNLDMYFRMSYEEPKLVSKLDLQSSLDKNNQSVYNAFKSFNTYYTLDEINTSIVDLMICWRNRLVHYKSDNKPDKEVIKILKDNQEIIKSRHNGMDINIALNRFENRQAPSFKEITSMIKALIEYVYSLDKELIANLDMVLYCDKVIIKYLRENKDKRLQNIYKNDIESRIRVICNILKDYGIYNNEIREIDDLVIKIANLTYDSAKKSYEMGTFV